MLTGGGCYIAGRAYTLTDFIVEYLLPADNASETWTVTVNGVDSAALCNVPNGSTIGIHAGLPLAIARADEICLHYDGGADGSGAFVSITLHLEPL